MPRHSKSAEINLDTMRPGSDNDAHHGKKMPRPAKYSSGIKPADKQRRMRSATHEAPAPKDRHYAAGGSLMRDAGHQGQQATSLPGQVSIISNVQKPGRGAVGIPGIISSTTLSPEVRNRLVAGVIETPMAGERETGAVHRVQGVDSTAYNEGMVHIAGSRFK